MTPPSRRALASLALLGLALAIALARLCTYHEPLERDITSAAVIGRELLTGRSLYADLWDHKPPAIHLTHALAIVLVGHGPGAIYLLNIAAAIVTLLGVYVAASAVGGIAGGLWGAVFWTLVCGDLWLQANQPNAEVFVNACVIWAFALLVRATGQPHVGRVLAIGALLALASLYKPVAAASAAFLAAAHVVAPGPGCSRRRALGDGLLIGCVGAAAWLATGAYFALRGHFGDFYQAVFAYNRYYASHYWADDNTVTFQSTLSILVDSLIPGAPFPTILSVATTLAVFTLAGAVRGAISGPRRLWLLMLGLAIGTHIAVALPGQWRPHYYQLWLPLLAVGAGWAAATSLALGRRSIPRWVPSAVAAAVAILIFAQQVPLYQMPPDGWSRLKYGEAFVQERNLGRELGALLAPTETFYEWGADTGLYFESRHSPPVGAFYVYPLLYGPETSPLTARTMAVLERRPPAMIVVNRRFRDGHQVVDWAKPRYVIMAGNVQERWPFLLLVRRGSRLDINPR